MPSATAYPKPDATHVTRLLESKFNELDGLHKKIKEIEALRYFEDKQQLSPDEVKRGFRVKMGLTAELVENVKAAMTTNTPKAVIHPHRNGDAAKANSSLREKCWNWYFQKMNHPVPVLSEFADSQIGNGIGILKAVFRPWPTKERYRKPKENSKDYKDRTDALKRMWGPPLKALTVHPLGFYFNRGEGNEVDEVIEHSWKPKNAVFAQYGIETQAGLDRINIDKFTGQAMSGQPDQRVRGFPEGFSSESYVLLTEYWNPGWYQVYIGSKLVYEEAEPSARYFISVGRSSSSQDADKFGISVAEIMRHNEPIINMMLSRMAEATDLIVRKRNTIELPESGQIELDEEGVPKTYTFSEESSEALPPGSKVVDPFAGAENAYDALPFVQLMLQIAGEHGVSPIFKGVPPSAQSSGYRDNSLYMMARSLFNYLLESYSGSLTDFVIWAETMIVTKIKQPVWFGEYELKPSDIEAWPCSIEVSVEPALPANYIAEGTWLDRMHTQGHVTRRRVQEKGIGIESPEDEEFERLLEDLKDGLKPVLIQDVISTVLPMDEPTQEGGLVDTSGRPLGPSQGGRQQPGGVQQLLQQGRASGQDGALGQSNGGMTRAGQERQPPNAPGATEQTLAV